MRFTKAIPALMILVLAAASCPGDTVTTAPAPKKKSPRPTRPLFRQISSVSLAKMPLMRVLRYYSKLSGLTIDADWNALKAVGIKKTTPVTLKARNLKFDKLLDLTLNSIAPKGHPLSWHLSGKVIHISTQMRVLLRNRAATTSFKRVRTVKRAGLAPREIEFTELPVKDAIAFLREISGANFHVNWRALETVGVSRETPVTVKARNISVARALDLITEQLSAGRDRLAGIHWVVQDGVVKIATGEVLNRNTKVRIFEIGDLMMVVRNFRGPRIGFRKSSKKNDDDDDDGWGDDDDDDDDDDEESPAEQRRRSREMLIKIIKMSIGEDMWAPTGKGSIRIYRKKLIISQTPLGFKLLDKSLSR